MNVENLFDDGNEAVELQEEEILDLSEIEDESEEPKQQLHTKSKEEQKIVHLKKALKEKEARIKELESKTGTLSSKDDLVSSYVAKGYDKDTAEGFAETQLDMATIKEKIELQEFKEENANVLSRYPNAINDIKWLMNASKATGMTVEQICVGKYGNDIQTKEQRNKNAVLNTNEKGNPAVSNAIRNAASPENYNMTVQDERQKEFFENLLGNLSTKEYLELKEKHKL